eukprot:1553851-Pleurochrysis_carterae.AAC.5
MRPALPALSTVSPLPAAARPCSALQLCGTPLCPLCAQCDPRPRHRLRRLCLPLPTFTHLRPPSHRPPSHTFAYLRIPSHALTSASHAFTTPSRPHWAGVSRDVARVSRPSAQHFLPKGETRTTRQSLFGFAESEHLWRAARLKVHETTARLTSGGTSRVEESPSPPSAEGLQPPHVALRLRATGSDCVRACLRA